MSETFALQVSGAGKWRNVVMTGKEQMQEIEHHAEMIARIAGSQYKWRIILVPFNDVIGYCNAPDFTWTPAK